MGNMYRHDNVDGSTEFNDKPVGLGKVTQITPEGRRLPEKKSTAQEEHKRASAYIKLAQKHVPNFNDYLEYADYLRHYSPQKFSLVMDELKRQDIQTWMKLQKYPQFRPLRETATGLKAGQNLMGAAVGLAGGNFTGSVEKWTQTVLKDLMKRDRYGPYADVLGSKASTLPEPKAPIYSNSRLGQYNKVEDTRLAQQAKSAEKEVAAGRAAVRGSISTSIGRVGGTGLDFGIAALNVESWNPAAILVLKRRLEKLSLKNPAIDIDTGNYENAAQLLSEGRYVELSRFLKKFE